MLWIKDDYTVSQFLRIAYSCRCASPILTVIDSQQNIRMSGQKAVALQHTIFSEDPVDIDDGIRLRQNGVIPGLGRSEPLRFLPLIGKDAVQFDAWVFDPKTQNNFRRQQVNSFSHAGEEIRHSLLNQRTNLPLQRSFQCDAPHIFLIIAPGEFFRAVTRERTGFSCFLQKIISRIVYGDYIPLIMRIITPILYGVNDGGMQMIVFDNLWVLMKEKGISTYQLREKCGIDSKTIRRLRANDNMETKTLNKLCAVLSCEIGDIAKYVPDDPA